MARGFLPTLGVATTDRIQTLLTSHAVRRTYAAWTYSRSHTNASIFDKSNASVQFERVQDTGGGSNAYSYKRQWSGGLADWSAPWPATSTGVWIHITVTYNGSSTTNAPSIYYNGIPQTVTAGVAASGTLSTNTDAYWIGNRGGGDRGWDGMLAEAAIWDRILSPAEIQLLAAGWSPSAIFRAGLVEYLPLDGTVESKVRGPLKPTTTGTLWHPHPTRIIGLKSSKVYFTQAPSPALVVTPSADLLAFYDDAAAKALRTLSGWNDQLTTFVPGVLPLAVNPAADSFPAYADTPTILFTGALAVSISDSLGLYADAATITERFNAASIDLLGLYADQPPAISETLIASSSDSLGLSADQATVNEGILSRSAADSLAGYADQLTLGSSGSLSMTLSDSLGLYSDQAPTLRQNIFTALAESLTYTDTINGFFVITTRPSSDDLNQWADIPVILGGQNIGLAADSFNIWADAFTKLHGESVGFAVDSMAPADQLGGAVAKLVQLSDALPVYADQILVSQGGQKLAQLSDGLPIWSDQIATTGGSRVGWADSMTTASGVQRQGWVDSGTVTTQPAGARTVNLSDARPGFTDSISEGYGYQHGFVIYLVDENGNYIVDENGSRFIVSGLIDNLQQGDSLAITRTTAGTTPRIVSISDTLAGYGDNAQFSIQIVTLQISLSDDLINYSDSFNRIAGFGVGASDDVGGYNDSNPLLNTSGEKRVDQSDALPSYADALQVTRFSFIDLAFSLADNLGGYADAIIINTSGGLLTSSGDNLAGYNDTTAIERTGTLSGLLTDALAFADQATINLGILRSATDNLAAYADSPAQLRGLLYSTLADGAANYLDLITAGGTGQIQAALADNLGQYNDSPPATFANFKVQPPADALVYADSTQRVLAVGYALSDSALALDDLLDVREGLFNELRYGLSDNMNQWADAAAYSRVFLAIKLSGKVIEGINLNGRLIDERISLTGGVYTGDP
jgi:hypothetical protein